MSKLVVNGIEMDIVGIKKDRMIFEYEATLYAGTKFENVVKRNPSFKMKKTKKGTYITVNGKRIYINEELKEFFGQWFENKED